MKMPLQVDAITDAHPKQIIAKGEAVITAGSSTEMAYYLLSGTAKGQLKGVDGQNFVSGHVVSLVSFLGLEAYDNNVIATTPCEVLVMPRLLIEHHWSDEDSTSWVFACSMASDAIKKYQALTQDYSVVMV
jgi:CRP-like cAMP-binding protein